MLAATDGVYSGALSIEPMDIRPVGTTCTLMSDLLIFGLAYLLAPSLVVGAVWLFGVFLGLSLAIVTVALAAFAAVLVISAGARWFKHRLSLVRRRRPRPTAWRQWR